MLIRKATPADLEAVFNIESRSFETERFNRRQLLYLISKAGGLFLVLELETGIAAYLSVLTHKKHKSLRIYSIAVDAARRGQGLGQKLIEQAIAYALDLHLQALSLEVHTQNSAAIALYTRNGFRVVGMLEDYYGPGEHAQRMRKEL